MGDTDHDERLDALEPYQVDEALMDLAKRDMRRYGVHMQNAANSRGRFSLTATEIERARQSGVGYAQSLFGGKDKIGIITTQPKASDPKLRPWDACPVYKTVTEHPALIKAKEEAAQIYAGIAKRLSKFFGTEVSPKEATAMYAMCRSQVSLCKNNGMWCNVFSLDEFKQMEYAKDIVYWHHHGPGYAPNVKMAAPLFKEIFEQMEGAITGRPGPMFHLRFSHAETVARVYDFLNWLKKPTRKLHHDELTTGQWLPFMANVHFELYRKGAAGAQAAGYETGAPAEGGYDTGAPAAGYETGAPAAGYETGAPAEGGYDTGVQEAGGYNVGGGDPYKDVFVRMLVNEKPTVIPGCGNFFCPYAKFKASYHAKAQEPLETACADGGYAV